VWSCCNIAEPLIAALVTGQSSRKIEQGGVRMAADDDGRDTSCTPATGATAAGDDLRTTWSDGPRPRRSTSRCRLFTTTLAPGRGEVGANARPSPLQPPAAMNDKKAERAGRTNAREKFRSGGDAEPGRTASPRPPRSGRHAVRVVDGTGRPDSTVDPNAWPHSHRATVGVIRSGPAYRSRRTAGTGRRTTRELDTSMRCLFCLVAAAKGRLWRSLSTRVCPAQSA